MISIVTRRRRRPFAFATGATGTTTFGTTPIIGATRAAITFRPRRTQLVHRQLAVAVLVEFLEGGAGIGDFRLINHTIVVRVEGGHQRRGRRALPVSAGSTRFAGLARTARAFATRRALASRRRAASILCGRHP